MRHGLVISFILPCAIVSFILTESDVRGQETTAGEQIKVGDTAVSVILERLGAKLEFGLTPAERLNYIRVFNLLDQDGDQRHSREEYIQNGRYLTPQSRRGIFRASDNDQDGFVTQAEYLLNRIITDEAKSLIQSMDDSHDGTVQTGEFFKHAQTKLKSEELARDVFAALDTNRDGEIILPEYLQVWGRWARAGQMSAEKRIENLSQANPETSRSSDAARRNGMPRTVPSFDSVLTALDTNQDQQISADEISNAIAALKKLDVNDDGKLSAQELSRLSRRRNGRRGRDDEREGGGRVGRPAGSFGPPSVEEVFQRLDANRDGKLQQDEVPEFAGQFIFPADQDNDQVVTKNELKKFRESQNLGNRRGDLRPEQRRPPNPE